MNFQCVFFSFTDEQAKTVSSPPNTELVKRKKHRQMDRLRRTLSFRSRKKGNSATNNNNNNNNNNNHSSTTTTSTTTGNTSVKNGNNTTTTAENKPPQWQDDEKAVRNGACSFSVKVKLRIMNYSFCLSNSFCLVFGKCWSTRITRNACLWTSYTSSIKCNYNQNAMNYMQFDLCLAKRKTYQSCSAYIWWCTSSCWWDE